MDGRALYRRFVDEAVVGGDLTVVDELFAPDAVLPAQGDLDGLRAQLAAQGAGLDISVRYDHQFTDGDWVITHMTLTIAMIGAFMGQPPTDRIATVPEIEVVRLQDGRIVEMWSVVDFAGGMHQLGLRIP
jgi:predicted ester cyclase